MAGYAAMDLPTIETPFVAHACCTDIAGLAWTLCRCASSILNWDPAPGQLLCNDGEINGPNDPYLWSRSHLGLR
jgi:hypothetical protein